jgi:hypothetical protein
MSEITPSNVLADAFPKLTDYVRGTSLLLPHNMAYDEWAALGAWLEAAEVELKRNYDLVRCLRGDWWNYGTQAYGHTKAQQAQSMWGVSALTVANDASALRRVHSSAREVSGATFGQLEAVRFAEPTRQAAIIIDAVTNDLPPSEVERMAKGIDRPEWERGRLLAKMRNAYNDLDATGRDEWHRWYLKVRRLDA